jgi:hypothetical protein
VEKIWRRRIGVISMPCRSVCAGLISLGAIRRDLEREEANYISGHYEALHRAANTSLQSSETSQVLVVDKNEKKWIFSEAMDGLIKVNDASYKTMVKRKGKLIPNPNGPTSTCITKANATDWRLEGFPVVESQDFDADLIEADYSFIPGCEGGIHTPNLSRSYGGVLLVGAAEGKDSEYVKSLQATKIGQEERLISLADLLTLHPGRAEIQRVDFCSQQNLEIKKGSYHLVIADGALAFHRAVQCFKDSDIVGVVSRDEPADNIISVAAKLDDLERFYNPIEECHEFGSLNGVIGVRMMESQK